MKATLGISLLPVVALIFPAIASAQGSERSYFHPKLRDKDLILSKLVLLPPGVEVTKEGVKGNEGMGKESEDAARNFSIEVTAALSAKGASVTTPFTEEALNGNDELRSAVADVQRQFDEVATKVFTKKKDVAKGRFTVGDGVAVLNTKGDADAFVVVRAAGTKETGTKKFMKRGLIGLAATHGKVLYRSRVAIIDAKSGDILFLGDYSSWDSPGTKLFEKSFKKLPVKSS